VFKRKKLRTCALSPLYGKLQIILPIQRYEFFSVSTNVVDVKSGFFSSYFHFSEMKIFNNFLIIDS